MNQQPPYSLLSALGKVKLTEPPPIHLWHSECIKDIDMEIKANGDWYYLGTPIKRQRLVHLFASILRLEVDAYYLVTPVEKCRIQVEDVPFQIIAMEIDKAGRGQVVSLTTNMAEELTVDDQHPLHFQMFADCVMLPYVEVRAGLKARFSRNVYYQLAEYLVPKWIAGEHWLGLWSCGRFFPGLKLNDSHARAC